MGKEITTLDIWYGYNDELLKEIDYARNYKISLVKSVYKTDARKYEYKIIGEFLDDSKLVYKADTLSKAKKLFTQMEREFKQREDIIIALMSRYPFIVWKDVVIESLSDDEIIEPDKIMLRYNWCSKLVKEGKIQHIYRRVLRICCIYNKQKLRDGVVIYVGDEHRDTTMYINSKTGNVHKYE